MPSEMRLRKKAVVPLYQAIESEKSPSGRRRGATSTIVTEAPVGVKTLNLPTIELTREGLTR